MVNSPCLFLQVVEVSFKMTPLESSRFFTSLGFFISNALQASARQNHTLPSFTITLSFPKLLLIKYQLTTNCIVYTSCYGFGGACELLQCEMFCKCHFFLIFKNLFIFPLLSIYHLLSYCSTVPGFVNKKLRCSLTLNETFTVLSSLSTRLPIAFCRFQYTNTLQESVAVPCYLKRKCSV